MLRRLVLVALASALAAAPAPPAGAAPRLYWTTDPFDGPPAIRVADLDGPGTSRSLFAPDTLWLGGLALDPAAGRVYWTQPLDEGTQAIMVGNLDGSGSAEVVRETQNRPDDIAIDPAAAPTSAHVGRAIERLRLDRRCVRRSRSGMVRARISIAPAPAGRVRVLVERAVGSRALRRCPGADPRRPFTGRLRAYTRAKVMATRGRTAALNLRLTPGLYRLSVRAVLEGNRLSPPARRYLRVLRS